MRRCGSLIGLLPLLLLVFSSAAGAAEIDRDWPHWRGPDASGSVAPQATEKAPPVQWSETENIRWKISVPGIGNSTPIVLGDRVYVSTAVKTERVKEGAAAESEADQEQAQGEEQTREEETQRGADDSRERFGRGRRGDGERGERARGREGDRDGPRGRFGRGGRGRGGRRGFGGGAPPTNYYDFMLLAYDRASGEEVWRTTLTSEVPHESGHGTNTFASASPVTDGERLYVSFGSRGVFCLDMKGEVLWEKDLGQMQTRAQFGEGSSPAVHEGTLVVPWDHEGQSFIVALEAKSGDEIWRVDRDEQTTWATPLITEYEGEAQVITNGTNRVRSYDLKTGELIWECGGQTANPIPSPVRYKDNVIVMSGFRGNAIYSIPLNAEGDVTDSDVVTWFAEDEAPYVPSPVLYQGQLYFVKSNDNILVSRNAESGEVVFGPKRLRDIDSIYASPVAAGGHVYLTGRDGTTVVIRHGDELDVVATNSLDAKIDASAAIADGQIFLRGKSHLYCIAEN